MVLATLLLIASPRVGFAGLLEDPSEAKRIQGLDIEHSGRAYKEVLVWCLRLIAHARDRGDLSEAQMNVIQGQLLQVLPVLRTIPLVHPPAVCTITNWMRPWRVAWGLHAHCVRPFVARSAAFESRYAL